MNAENSEERTVEVSVGNFALINIVTVMVPFYACLALFLLFEYCFIMLFSIQTFIHFLLLPGFFIFLYYIYIVLLIEFSAMWVRGWNKKEPPQQGIFERVLEDVKSPTGRMIKYYHKRGFIIKFPMWLASKSPFPWLLNRVLRRIGHNKIGKNVIYCDGYAGLEFTDLGDNTFIYPTSVLSSHAVNSIFGKISILKINLGKNTTMYPGSVAGPGVLSADNNVFFPNTSLVKNWRGVPERLYYQGSPGRPIKVKHLTKEY